MSTIEVISIDCITLKRTEKRPLFKIPNLKKHVNIPFTIIKITFLRQIHKEMSFCSSEEWLLSYSPQLSVNSMIPVYLFCPWFLCIYFVSVQHKFFSRIITKYLSSTVDYSGNFEIPATSFLFDICRAGIIQQSPFISPYLFTYCACSHRWVVE